MKACWWCKHMRYTNADSGWGEYTPGWDFSMRCEKKHWEFDAFDTSQEQFGKNLSMAENCPDFEILPWLTPPVGGLR